MRVGTGVNQSPPARRPTEWLVCQVNDGQGTTGGGPGGLLSRCCVALPELAYRLDIWPRLDLKLAGCDPYLLPLLLGFGGGYHGGGGSWGSTKQRRLLGAVVKLFDAIAFLLEARVLQPGDVVPVGRVVWVGVCLGPRG